MSFSSAPPLSWQRQIMEDYKPHHVVLFPFLARSHINPFLTLANLLARHRPSFTLTVVSTPLNIQSIRSSIPPDYLASSIRLRSIPFNPASHGLPPDVEELTLLPILQRSPFLVSTESLLPAFEQLIGDIMDEDGRPPLCIIADFFFSWSVHVARKFGVFHSLFLPGGAYGMAMYYLLWTHLPHMHTSSDEFPLPGFSEMVVKRTQLDLFLLAADGTDKLSVFTRRVFSLWTESDGILVNTVEEMESTGLRILRKSIPKPIWSVGPLLSSSGSSSISGGDRILKWLEEQPPASVLYISFGSLFNITAAQTMEIALGLDASGVRFVWAIRPPHEFDTSGETRGESLPERFEERMQEQGRGVLVEGWSPQLEILSHRATGAFLSHCGWSSVLESLSRGVPIIAWPIVAEQMQNARMLEEEMGVCMEVPRRDMENSRVEVERVVREVMDGGENSREMRRRAEMARELMKTAGRDGVGSSVLALNDFFQAVVLRDRR